MVRIMIVDDTAFMRTLLRTIMTDAGFSVVAEAVDGREAVQAYQKFKPDVVTMDITMPEMEGIEAVKEIIYYDPNARIIMCSSVGNHRNVLDAISIGAKDFIVKPFDKERIVEAVINVLRRD